ncbi:O-antigen ligase [Aquimarina sp. MAR_2010_214]|uniref:O-antigen ligase family protein n=1 Tax=Aquimarina sp. MAR_2010_214 TaxID=1250026 RepID=UPI000CCA31BD|nr:O-antigen ligase family protein [Aquimarina sp. MAR_2010_214]PKV48795.1 O-antigen ligase [Aquimarina sp. MAR_2010_214]
MQLGKIVVKATSMFYREDHWVVMTFWNSLYIAFFLLPLGINLPTPFFIISIIFGIGMMFRSEKKFVLDKSLLLFPLYFIVMSLGLIYTDNLISGFDLVQRSLSLLLFPLIFLFVKEDATTVKRLFDFLLVGLVVSFCINVFKAAENLVWHVVDEKENIEIFFFLEGVAREWHHFFVGPLFSRSVNTNYISIYILLVLSYYLKNKLQSRLQLAIVLILFSYLFLLASVAAYLILFIMSILLISDIADKQDKYTMTIIFLMGMLLFLNNPRISDFYSRMKDFNSTGEYYDIITSEKSKLLAWDASIELIKDAPIFGYGVGDANDVLIEKYKELNYTLNYTNKYNAHNQFLQTYLQSGIIGFGVLVSIFVLLAIRMKRSRNEFSVFLILFISLLFESMLVRFNGIVFFSIVTPLLLKKRSILSSRIIRNDNNT